MEEVPGDLVSRLCAVDQAEAAVIQEGAVRDPADVTETVAALAAAMQDIDDGDEGIPLEEYIAGTAGRDHARDAAHSLKSSSRK